jgi:site-specific DNA recombinase
MIERQVALYARVSSEQQAEANTIDSQVAVLRERIAADGVDLQSVCEFIDAGYSGSSLVRPALERLRDVAAAGGLDRLYVHCPDRLARHYAYQVLLLDELTQRAVEVIFLNRPLGHTPEDQLLLHVQGVIAEYERAKFLERSRRGKRHAAQAGRVGVLCHAPYGYRYVPKQEGGGDARFDIVWDEARVVQQVFAWVGRERCTINAVCRRLHQADVRTRTGKAHWDHKTIWDMLHNPAYKGEAAFGKTRWTPVGPRLRAPRGRPAHSRRGYSGKAVPPDEWITIPVPALVEAALFDAVQAQLDENRRRARIPEKGSRYVLQGLLVCRQCGYAYCGRTNDARNAYYRCAGAMNIPRHGFERICGNKPLRMEQTDAAVWHEVCQLLAQPTRLEQAYRQRLHPQQQADAHQGLETQIGKLRRGMARLIDSYAEGLIDKQEFEPRVTQMRARLQHLEAQVAHLKAEGEMEEELRLVVGRLETFAAKVHDGLQQADFHTRREIIRSLVKRVEVDQQHIQVVFRVSPTSVLPSSDNTPNYWQDSGKRVHARAFHRDDGAVLFHEPVGESQERRIGGRKLTPCFAHVPGGIHAAQTRGERVFVDVDTTTDGMFHLHRCPLLRFGRPTTHRDSGAPATRVLCLRMIDHLDWLGCRTPDRPIE